MPNNADIEKRRDKLLTEVDLSSPQALVKSLTTMIGRLEINQETQLSTINQIQKLLEVRDIVLSDEAKLPSFPGISNITINADMPMEGGRGFYELEFNSAGAPYRWTGPENAFSFRLLLDRSQDLNLTLTAVNTLDKLNRESLLCNVNGVSIELEPDTVIGQKDEAAIAFSGVLPALADTQRFNSSSLLKFYVPSVLRPAELWEDNSDQRLLGLAFTSLEISAN